MTVKYGIEWPEDMTDVMIELACMYRPEGWDTGVERHVHQRNAMMLLWPSLYAGEVAPGVPRWRDDLELMLWAWNNHKTVSVIGHASAGKTHTFGHIAATHYIASSSDTIITLTSTHLPGLRQRLWSDVVDAMRTAKIGPDTLAAQMFEIRNFDLTIRPDPKSTGGQKEDKYIISGIATSAGQDAVEKIQGTHSKNHRFVIVDEAQGTAQAIFDASANLMTDPDFRQAFLANPTRRHSPLGSWCEPEKGWGAVDPESDLWWATKRGGVCIRLDGMRSPNIRSGTVHFPFLIKPEYLEDVRKGFGENSPRWWTFVRGWFAPEGLFGVVFPENVLIRGAPKHEYAFPPVQLAAVDPAFEGADSAAICFAEFGETKASKWALNLNGSENLKLSVREGDDDPLDYKIAHEVIRKCKDRGIEPENVIVDVTGAGRGVAAILAKEWGQVQRCAFGSGPTDRRLKLGDLDTSADLFDRFVSELWWAARVWMEEGQIGNLQGSTFDLLRKQLAAREYETIRDKKISIETKIEMKKRVGYSPDEADAFVMLVELLRRRGAVVGSGGSFAGGDPRERLMRRAKRYSDVVDPDREFMGAA